MTKLDIQIRKAKPEEYKIIAPLLLLAMEDIVYRFIGDISREKAILLLESLVREENTQYSYKNCWIAENESEIIAAACVYDGMKLRELRKPVAEKIKSMFNNDFNPEDETRAGEYYIDSVGVSPNHQGKGIGTKVFQFLINEYVTKRNETLGLLVEEDNPDARKLYLKLGFETVGKKTLVGKTLQHLQLRQKNRD
uniref:GNAT family N-acetyltransferase n=1 Tax=uncultured Draconibacterium sp. TaxID=1573823 RepID=UPI003217029D